MNTYRDNLDDAQVTLTAVTLAGAGTLATPGLAAQAALQTLLTAIEQVDAAVVQSWNEQAIRDRLATDAAAWGRAHSAEFATPERAATRQLDFAIDRREEVVIESIIVATRLFSARLSGPRNQAEAALLAFEAAVAAFTGGAGELAIGTAALVAMTNVATTLGFLPAYDVDPSRMWSRSDWPATVLCRGR